MKKMYKKILVFIFFAFAITTVHVFQSKEISASSLFNYDASGWWNITGYDPNKTTDRLVSGDFNGDGKTDTAAFYDYGSKITKLHVWLSNGTSFTYLGPDGWWNQSGYDSTMISKRVVAGDFTGDGKDDIAVFYDYGTETRVHVWKSTGTTFTYQGESGWWKSAGYDAKKIAGRVVSNDFNNDGKDDLAAFYDYGNGQTKLHVWTSTGSSFTYQGENGWWNTTGYNANMLTDRVVSGDFNKDGKDDIAAFYNYNDSETRIHVWASTGTSFSYQGPNGWWGAAGYNANNITGKVVAGDFNSDGKTDIGAFYDYGNSTTKIHIWLSEGSTLNYQTANGWWEATGYNPKMITGRVVAGNFDGDSNSDIAAFYDYGASSTKAHVWTSEYVSETFIWPVVESTRITQLFKGDDHKGIDIGARTQGVEGDTIVSFYNGTVAKAGWSTSYGWVVYIHHVIDGKNVQSRYAHLVSQPIVSTYNTVTAGQRLGYMGNTGASQGVHLHFETRNCGAECKSDNNESIPFDPLANYFPQYNMATAFSTHSITQDMHEHDHVMEEETAFYSNEEINKMKNSEKKLLGIPLN
ncbi:peptidoglycan DD-metalloendopeptidase family protein [Fictibacillus nanhaiensis]|uniref:peptidoglycan DD-metalloendopeptidase family protein n=1 Tax=Fictibacillus nanhaiensis TaxID=742169 RepID=UPI003C18D5D1